MAAKRSTPSAMYAAAFHADLAGLTGAQSLNVIGSLIDLSESLGKPEGARRALEQTDQIDPTKLAETDTALLEYFRANAWSVLHRHENANVWDWEQPALGQEIFHLRKCVSHAGFVKLEKLRRCQVFTNLGNCMDTVGRFVEAQDYWGRAIALEPKFGMAIGNMGYGLETYARALYDRGHQMLFLKFAHVGVKTALRKGILFDGPYPHALAHFDSVRKRIESAVPRLSKVKVDGYESFSVLTFEVQEGQQKPGLVIDGQHRLLGMNEYSPDTNVNVVAILGADDVEKAFQFLVINNKASKVSLDHIRALALHYEDEALKTRLTTARLTLNPNVPFVGLVNDGDDSPFRGMISWPLTPEKDRIVVPAAIEGAISLIQQTKVREFESDDVLLEFFYTIWRRIKQAWPQFWVPNSRLLSKVGIICMTQYMTDSLVSSYDLELLDISDPEAVGKKIDSILLNQVAAFWATPWTSTSYDTKVGKSMIVNALVQIARNVRSGVAWYEDIGLVDPANVEEIESA